MKKKDPKWLNRFDGMMAWNGEQFNQFERAKQRRKDQRKKNQNAKIKEKSS